MNVSITVDRHPCYRIEKTPSSQRQEAIGCIRNERCQGYHNNKTQHDRGSGGGDDCGVYDGGGLAMVTVIRQGEKNVG